MKYTPTFKGTWCEMCGCEMDCRNCKYKDKCRTYKESDKKQKKKAKKKSKKSKSISHEQYDYE